MRKYQVSITLAILTLSGCGGGGGSPAPVAATVGGMVSGLVGAGLVLANNGGDHLAAQGDGSFAFTASMPPGSSYSVTVVAQPTNPIQLCRVSNGSGLVSTVNVTDVAVSCATSALSLFAGQAGGFGSQDGAGASASFYLPSSVATDSTGNTYVADTQNNIIRKVTPSGVVTTLAGTAGVAGSTDGTGAEARFYGPSGVATDSAGNVYVADTQNSTIRKITPSGTVTTLAGTAGMSGSGDGTGAAARFAGPKGVATDSAGDVYAADTGNATIRKITTSGVVTTMAGTAGVPGSADGTGAAASFWAPTAVTTDSANNLYVADWGNSTIRKITPAGVVTTLAGTALLTGSQDGTGADARFDSPSGVATDSAGNVYVADTNNATIRKISPSGVVTTIAGTAGVVGSVDGTGMVARFLSPLGVATDSAGNVYVADGNIRKISPLDVVTTLAGTVEMPGSADGLGAAARFNDPSGIATDTMGNVYVADNGNNTIRKITPSGLVTTLAGTAGVTGSADGLGALASFFVPSGVSTDSVGNVYVADSNNNTIRKITSSGVVTTLAGTAGVTGSADGTGAAASFSTPIAVATDSAGNVYVADSNNDTIRKVTPMGVVTTLAGTAGRIGSVDGTGAAANFWHPGGVAADSDGNVYVADSFNHIIRKITPTGVVTTLAGTAGVIGIADGTGAAASFNSPYGVTVDGAGNVYVADFGNDIIRSITPSGVVTTIVGKPGVQGYLFGPLPGVLAAPQYIAIFGSTLYATTRDAVVQVENLP